MRSQRPDSGLSIETIEALQRERPDSPDKRELELALCDYNQPEIGLRKGLSLSNAPFLKAPLTAVHRDIGKRTVTTLIIVGLYDFIMKVAGQGKLPPPMPCITHNLAADSILRKPRWRWGKEASPILARPSLRRENPGFRCDHTAGPSLLRKPGMHSTRPEFSGAHG